MFFESSADAMLLMGVALLCVITLRQWYRRHGKRGRRLAKKREAAPVLANKPPNYSAPMMDAPTEVLRWQVEMHDLARDLSAQLDSKMSALQALVARAEAQCERMEKLMDELAQAEK